MEKNMLDKKSDGGIGYAKNIYRFSEARPKHPDDQSIEELLSKQDSADWEPDDLLALKHIGSCDYCARQLAECAKQDGLIAPPQRFKEEVLAKSRLLRIQTEKLLYKTSARMQLLLYSLRVGTAVVGALAVLFLSSMLISLQPDETTARKEWEAAREIPSFSLKMHQQADQLSQLWQDFSYKIIHMEVKQNDK